MNSKLNNSIPCKVAAALTLTCAIFYCLPAFSQTNGPGTGVSLDGTTNAWINVPGGTWFSGDFTVEAWVYERSYNNWSRLIDFSDGLGTDEVSVALTAGVTGDPAINAVTSAQSLPTNQWVHLAATGNGTNGTIYLNGTPVGTGTIAIAPGILRTDNYIGRSPDTNDSYPNAMFDEVRIWNQGRSRTQILTSMNHPLAGNEPGLIGYWRFDEGHGTYVFDSTANGNTATLNSGVTWTNSTAALTNAANYALSFNGSQTVNIPRLAAQDGYPFTVMCWFMEPTNSPGGGALVGNYVSGSHNGWQIAIDSQLYAWYWRDASDDVARTGNVAVNDGTWHHAAFVVSSAGGILYLDGAPKQTNAWAGTAGPCTAAGQIFLGIYQGNSLLTGDIDEVSVWNVALTQSQIQTYMHHPLQGTESGLVNYYRMNEGAGTNIYDFTTNADTGTFSPAPPTWIVSGAQVQPYPPQIATLPATVSGDSAVLNGAVNPQGAISGSWFNWGSTTSYGNVTVTNVFADGYTTITNTATLSGLSNGTYHYQVVATNAGGTNFGADQAFTINVQYALSTSNLLVGPTAGGSGVILAASAVNATWTMAANAPWLHVPPGINVGSTNAIFTFDANTGVTRSGTVSIANQTLTVTQAGSNYVAAPEPPITVTNSIYGEAYDVAVDSAGNAYFTAPGAGIFEWVKTNNTVTLLAQGSYYSEGIAVDQMGNVFFSDTYGNAIYEWVAASNQVVTRVNSGLYYPAGVAVDSSGNVYFADSNNNAIKEWVAANSNVVSLVSSGLVQPSGVAVDFAGYVYIADSEHGVIKKWSPWSGLTTLPGLNPGSYHPGNLAVDDSGNVFFADLSQTAIFEWSAVSNMVSVAASNGIASAGAAVDSAGNIYIGDSSKGLKELPHAFLDPSARGEPYVAGNDVMPAVLPTNALQLPPFIPTSDQSWLTITGVTNGVTGFSFTTNTTGLPRSAHVSLLTATIEVNQSAVVFGTTSLLEGPAAGTDSVALVVPPPIIPMTVSVSAGWLHPAGGYPPNAEGTNFIFTFDANPGVTRTGTIGIGNESFTVTQAGAPYVAAPAPLTALVPNGIGYGFGSSSAGSLAIDSAGNIYIAAPADHAIKEWVAASNSVVTLTSALKQPTALAIDNVDDLLFIADAGNGTLYVCGLPNSNPKLIPVVTSGLYTPLVITLDSFDNVYIADAGDDTVKRWNIDDGSITRLITNATVERGMTMDNAGDVYIAGTVTISGTNSFGIIEWVAATGDLINRVPGYYSSTPVAVDGSGNIYIANLDEIDKWTAATGNLSPLLSGNFWPVSMCVDNAGDLYFANAYSGGVDELPRAYLDPTARTEGPQGGSDALPPILPASVNLQPPFAPSTDQSWLRVTNAANGIVDFTFTSDLGLYLARAGHVNVLGEQVAVMQSSVPGVPILTGSQILGNGSFQFTFTNIPGTTFSVLATTNVTLPLNKWVDVGTVSNVSPGVYQFTTQPLTNAQEFYQVTWP